MQAPGGWEHLPHELLVTVFKYLQPQDLVSASTVCIEWFRVFHEPLLWRAWIVQLTDNQQNLVKDVQALRNVVHFLGRFCRRVRVKCPRRRPRGETGWLLWGYLTSLLQGLRLQGTRNLTYFRLSLCFGEGLVCRNEVYDRLIVQELALFLQSQACLESVVLRNCSLSTNYSEIIVDSIARSKARNTIDKLDIVNLYSSYRHTDAISEQLKTLFTGCQQLVEIKVNYRYLKATGVETVCQMLNSLRWLAMEVHDPIPEEDIDDEEIISSDSWRQACQFCPGLRVAIYLPSWRSHLRCYLVPGMPLWKLGVTFRYRYVYEGELGDTVSMLFYHLGYHFHESLRSIHVSVLSRNTLRSPTMESLVYCLHKCPQIETLIFSPNLMTPAFIQQVRSEVSNHGLTLAPDVLCIESTECFHLLENSL